MKHFFLFIFVLLFSSGYSQGIWETISPYPTAATIHAASFISPDTGWIVDSNCKIFSTSDGGETWTIQYRNPVSSVWDIFFIDANNGWVCASGKVLHTSDGGNSWEIQNLPGQYVSAISVFFINPDTGWLCGTYDRIYKTVNGGDNWSVVNSSGFSNATFLTDIEFFDGNNGITVGGYLMGNDTAVIMVSNDGGNSWSKTTYPEIEELSSVSYLSDGVIVAGSEGGSVMRSEDGGITWNIYPVSTGYLEDLHFFNSSDGIALASNTVYHTYDGGLTWEQGSYVNGLSLSFAGSTGYAVGMYGSVMKTENNGLEWKQISHFSDFGSLSGVSFIDDLNIWAFRINDTKLAKSTDGGYSWEVIDIGATEDISDICFVNGNTGFALGNSSKLYKTVNGGMYWQTINLNIGLEFNSFMFLDENVGFIGCNDGFLYRTTDGGQTWNTSLSVGSGTFMDINILNTQSLWGLNSAGSVYFSNDAGNSWTEKPVNADGDLTGFYFFNELDGLVISEYGVQYKTLDGGNTWQSAEIFYPYQNPLKIDFVDENEGWMIRGAVLFFTVDKGENWIQDISQFGMEDIKFFNPTGIICGNNGLIMKFNNTATFISENTQPDLKVWPNPVKSSDIHIVLKELCQYHSLEINVIDISGRQTSVDNFIILPDEVVFNASYLKKGLYYIVLKGEGAILGTAKFIVN